MKCPKCGSENLATRMNPKNASATDLFCSECGAWVKFANASERRKYPSEPKMVSYEYATCPHSISPNEYQVAALRTCDMQSDNAPVKVVLMEMFPELSEYGVDQAIREHPNFFELWNGVLGLNGEAGEVIDIFKKAVFQGHKLDEKHIAEELGDVAWYLAICAHAIGYDLEEILKQNIDKLVKRYPAGFDPERSIHREEHEGK